MDIKSKIGEIIISPKKENIISNKRLAIIFLF